MIRGGNRAGIRGGLALGVLALLVGAAPVAAKKLPLWEAGVGFTGMRLPDYRGSRFSDFYGAPIPYLVYRGKFLRVDREGVRGLLFDSERVQLDVSVDGAVPVNSRDEGPRSGMPDLRPVLEVGPSLRLRLTDPDKRRGLRVELQWPVRAVIATDLKDTDQEGWVTQPQLDLRYDGGVLGRPWVVTGSVGPLFGTERYHDYYYQVDPRYATAERPAYDAKAGYSGTRLTLGASRRFNRIWVGAYVRWDYLGGAVFEDSPLVERKNSVMAGFAVAWVFDVSDRMVDVRY